MPHPDTPGGTVHGIRARVSRTPDGALAVTYVVEGDLDRVRVPPPRPPRMADELWRHTCCELFVACRGATGYHEFNLSPSGEWAAYAFARYRERTPLNAEPFDPRIAMRRTAQQLELDALIPLGRLSPAVTDRALTLALSAVIEDRDGSLSCWALKHAPGKPDFHHPAAFALELE